MTVSVDNYTRVLMTVIAVLLTVIAFGMWIESPMVIPTARAGGIPDSGQQFNVLIQKIDQASKKSDELKKLLTSGKVKVQIVQPTGSAGANSPVTIINPVSK